jgi:2-polyprenyl-3-methyl-5-hydroxy-6-metoxy-1,4-benzoquinol methylase
MVYMSRSSAPPIEYAKDYFFDGYKKQYGKTYLEDFPNLVEMGRKRLEHIKGLLKAAPLLPAAQLPPLDAEYSPIGTPLSDATSRGQPGTDAAPLYRMGSGTTNAAPLLDIGCAYGPFLAAARDAGFAAAGFEVAGDAVAYVRDTLGIPCFKVPFPSGVDKAVFADGQFAAITLWYVIEHFEDTGAVLAEIGRLLRKGGVLAFSTPSFEGISAEKSRRKFLENSPQDHYTIWKPSKTRKILKRFGFSLRKIVVTGHHPERFPLAGRLLRKKARGLTKKVAEKPDAQTQAATINTQGPLYRALLAISRLFRLGDTFEVYATKD